MNETLRTGLRNALVLVLADGKVTDEERQLIGRLRKNLGIDRDEFRAMCEQAQANRKRLEIPTRDLAAENMLQLLIDVAKVDGEISESEQRMLEKVAAFIEQSAAQMEAVLAGGDVTAGEQVDDALEAKINAEIDQLYTHFAEWTEQERREHCRALGAKGAAAVIPLLRVVESYRNPDGGEGHQMKAMIMDQLAAIGDDCVVYYLAQQVSLGDIEDEVSSPALREAAAEAIGKITGNAFTRDTAGVLACRQWWLAEGTKTYRTLVL